MNRTGRKGSRDLVTAFKSRSGRGGWESRGLRQQLKGAHRRIRRTGTISSVGSSKTHKIRNFGRTAGDRDTKSREFHRGLNDVVVAAHTSIPKGEIVPSQMKRGFAEVDRAEEQAWRQVQGASQTGIGAKHSQRHHTKVQKKTGSKRSKAEAGTVEGTSQTNRLLRKPCNTRPAAEESSSMNSLELQHVHSVPNLKTYICIYAYASMICVVLYVCGPMPGKWTR
jgi:hypothetical protein